MIQLSQSQIENSLPEMVKCWLTDCIKNCDLKLPAEQLAEKLMVYFSKVPRFIKSNNTSYEPSNVKHNYSLIDLCRINILLLSSSQHNIDFQQLVKSMLRFSDDEEKISIAKGIIILDPDGLLVDEMIDLCRTNSTEVLSSLALDNSYPAKYFPEINFNQLILKSMFLGLDISRVENLNGRKNIELSRMAADYKQERINANRSVPKCLALAL